MGCTHSEALQSERPSFNNSLSRINASQSLVLQNWLNEYEADIFREATSITTSLSSLPIIQSTIFMPPVSSYCGHTLMKSASTDIGLSGKHEYFPLHYAAVTGDVHRIRQLICVHGLDPNSQFSTWNYTTPLNWAASFGQLVAVIDLVRLGADPLKNTPHQPIEDARFGGHHQVVRFLERYEAQLRLYFDNMTTASTGTASKASSSHDVNRHKPREQLPNQQGIMTSSSDDRVNRENVDRQRLQRETVVNLIRFLRTISSSDDSMLQEDIDELAGRIVAQYLDQTEMILLQNISLSSRHHPGYLGYDQL